MPRFVKFVGVHGEVAVNAARVLYAAPLPETGDCWLYFGGKGEGEDGQPAVIVVQVKGSLDEVMAALEDACEPAPASEQGGDLPVGARPAGERRSAADRRGSADRREASDRRRSDRRSGDDRSPGDDRPPLQAAAEDQPPLLPAPDAD